MTEARGRAAPPAPYRRGPRLAALWSPDPATQYALDVAEGREVAGPYVRASCRRHLQDLERDDLLYDEAAAERIFRFFETQLRLAGGQFEDRPFELQPSQRFQLGCLFGWKSRNTGFRRFRRAYIEQGKGNGKTPMSAGIGLYGLLADGEAGAQIYSAATTKDQADILFQDAVQMAQRNARMWKKILPSGKKKVFNLAAPGPRQRGSFFRPVSRSVGQRGSGPRPHFVLVDEMHEHANRDTLDQLERGFKFRQQPLVVVTTNSGSDRNSPCWEERQHAVAAALGDVEDDATFSYVCALDDGEDPLVDEACWRKVNPLLGTILTEEYLRGLARDALQVPGKRNKILRLHFCRWTDAETVWLPREAWEACEDPDMTPAEFAGKRCRAGLDLSSRQDITARALVFEDGEVPDPETGLAAPCFALFVHGYTPRQTLAARERQDRAPYSQWVEAGHLTATPGPFVRFSFVVRDLAEDQQAYDLQAVAYDRFLYTRFEEDMGEMGVDLPVVEHPQGFAHRRGTHLWMPGSIEFLEQLVLEGRLRVHVNPALRSAVAGATFVESPAGLKRFDKIRATQRIDMVVAAAMAVGAWLDPAEEDEESVYVQLERERVARNAQRVAAGLAPLPEDRDLDAEDKVVNIELQDEDDEDGEFF